MSETNFCQDCRFWDPRWKFRKERSYHQGNTTAEIENPRVTSGLRKKSDKGLCRRYAPQASALTTVWMETAASDWCGDFQATDSETE